MKKHIILIIVLFFMPLILVPFAAGAEVPESKNVNVIITFSDDINFGSLYPEANIKFEYNIINGIAASIPYSLYEILDTLPFVKSVELDGVVSVLQDTLDWGVDKIDAEVVWGNIEGATDVEPGTYSGEGIKVCVIDTGIDYNHVELDDNYKGGYDFVNDDNDPLDDHSHGTHCAGIIAAEDNGEGVIGVAPNADLYAVKVLSASGQGTDADVIAGINWAVDNGMDVISMSLGGGSAVAALETACNNARDAGVVVVCATGNDYSSTISYPARYESTIAVGASTSSDSRASFSNYGPEIDLVAPGVGIYSTVKDGDYASYDGTSMATPMVSGTVAMMLSKKPDLTPREVRDILHRTSLDLGDSGFDYQYGYGRVQVDEAINAISTIPDTIPPEQVTGLTVNTVSSSKLELSWNAVSDDDVRFYNIYQDETLVDTTSATSYIATGLKPLSTYIYQVSAQDYSGNEGKLSEAVSGTTAEPGLEDEMHVGSIEMSYTKTSLWILSWYDIKIDIVILDADENVLPGVVVSFDFTRPGGEIFSETATTGLNGDVSYSYRSTLWEFGTYSVSITNLEKTEYTYVSEDNIETSESINVEL